MKKKIFLTGGFILITSVLLAQVPNKFSPGDTLSSSKLNENFNYVGKVVKDGAGNIIGRFVSYYTIATGNFGGNYRLTKLVKLLNTNGYNFSINLGNGELGSMNLANSMTGPYSGLDQSQGYFSDAACTQPLIATTDVVGMNGEVFILKNQGVQVGVYYIPKTAIPNSSTGSYYINDIKMGITGPFNIAGSGLSFYTPIVNNSTITGVSSTAFLLPISIE